MLGRRQSATCGSDGRIVAKRPFFPSAGRHLSAPVLSGDLRVFSLPDILLLINTNHKSGLDEVARLVTLSDFDRTLLGLVDGCRTVRDIVTFARRDEFETWQGLHALLSAGVIRVQLLTLDPAQAVPTVAQHVDDADLERAIDQYGGAVAMLLYDPDRDSVVMVEQFRLAALFAGSSPWQLECVAGLMEPEESAEQVAVRETREEANLDLIGPLLPIQRFMPATGSFDETVDLFCGRVDSAGAAGLYGAPDEQEDIRVVVKPVAEIETMLDRGEIESSHSVICLYWLLRHRDRLRREWLGG